MDENRVSARDGTATIALVCRIILRLAHLSSMFRRISIFEHPFSCAGRSLAVASSRLYEYGNIYQILPKRQARSNCAIMHGLDVYQLPGRKPEVFTSRARGTECLHARVARMRLMYESHPRTPIAVRWCLR